MLRELRKGNARGVVIHKIDRSARNLKDWADLGELIDGGIEVHFANEALDLHSRGGRLPSQCSNRARWIRQRMAFLLRHGSLSSIVMKQHRRAKLSGNTTSVPILKAIRLAAKEHGIPMYVLRRAEIATAFRVFRARTKDEIACAVVGIFPELLIRLPSKRKKWQSEARAMIIFDAIATGIAYWQRPPPRT
jgi:hypothetical protein